MIHWYESMCDDINGYYASPFHLASEFKYQSEHFPRTLYLLPRSARMAKTDEQLRIHSRSWVSFSTAPGETERDLKAVACQQVQYIGLCFQTISQSFLASAIFVVTIETLEVPACTSPLEMHAWLRLHVLGMRSALALTSAY